MKAPADIEDKELTAAQNAAVYSVHKPISVVAGAGSGKTTVLIDRCRHIIGDDWGELDRLLAITFTEKAAGQLKARLRPMIPAREHYRLEGAWIGTFHSACARMLHQHAPLVGLDPSFGIMDENAGQLASRQCVKLGLLELLRTGDKDSLFLVGALDFHTATGAVEDMMQFRWHARRFLSNPASESEEEAKILTALARVYHQIENRLISHLERTGSLDFQELEIRALKLLDEHREVVESYQRRFRHILVDEFQDTNDLQTLLVLKLFHPEKNQLCIVGDPRQSIYRFRGANIDCFTTTLERIRACHGETIHLAENFRSRPNIVSFINSCQVELAEGLFGSLSADGIGPETTGMQAARRETDTGKIKTDRPLQIIRIELPEDEKADKRRESEGEVLSGFILDLVGRGNASFGDIALLFQALTDTSRYETAFRKAHIPYRMFGGRGLLERQEVTDLLAALAYASDPTDEVALLGILRSPLIGLSDDDLVLMAGPDGTNLIAAAKKDPRCSLLTELPRMALHLRPSEIIRRTLDITGYELICEGLDPTGGMTANLERLITLAESAEQQEPTPLADFVDFMRELKRHSARLSDPPAIGDTSGAVKCMTVHAAKGLEFPVVILPDLFRRPHRTGGNWIFSRKGGVGFKLKDSLKPFGKRIETERYKIIQKEEYEGEESESKRLLYVAMTRAMDLLVLPIHAGMKNHGPWHRWISSVIEKANYGSQVMGHASPLDYARGKRVTPALLPADAPVEDRRCSGGSHSSPVTCHLSPPIAFTVSELECHARCPQEYYLKYVLGLPSNELLGEGGEKLPANIFGSIVHGIMERFEPGIKLASIKELIETLCLANNVFPDSKTTRVIQKVIDSAIGLKTSESPGGGWKELHFDWNIKDSTITGSIDWLIPTKAGFEIVDFKTDRIGKEGAGLRAKEYELQMIAYALATEAATGKRVEATRLAFLEPGIIHTIPVDERRREVGMEQIESIIGLIRAQDFEIGEGTPPCFKCPYHHNRMCWKDQSKL